MVFSWPRRARRAAVRSRFDNYRPRVERLEARTLLAADFLDPTFGAAGVVLTSLSAEVQPVDVAVQPDGKILVAGIEGNGVFIPVEQQTRSAFLLRYNPDGSLDTNFGPAETPGRVSLQIDQQTNARELLLRPDGAVVLYGTTHDPVGPSTRAFLSRFDARGVPDPAFRADVGGLALGLAAAADGTIVVSAGSRLYRLAADGRPNPTFGQGGSIGVANFPSDVAVLADGKIVGVGHDPSASNVAFLAFRLEADGRPDPTFGAGGVSTLDLTPGADFAQRVFVQPDGKLLVSGRVDAAGGFVRLGLARVDASGVPDPTFGDGGQVVTGQEFTDDGVLQADGKLVVTSRLGGVLGVTRFNLDGSLDAGFGTDGTVGVALGQDFRGPGGVAVQPDGRLVVVGAMPQGLALARFLPEAPPSPNERLVTQFYADLLGRDADPAGLTYFAGLLDRGATRTEVAQRIVGSTEYRTVIVRQTYERLLGRDADAAGLTAWVTYLGQGGTAEQLEALVLASPEYQARSGGDRAWLEAVYRDALGRELDATGAAAWAGALANGATRDAVALAVLQSVEADRRAVDELYGRLLGRAADEGGRAAFTSLLQQGTDLTAVLTLIAGSDEYFSRA
jgi:uncharacterized delta-60 repeat protein